MLDVVPPVLELVPPVLDVVPPVLVELPPLLEFEPPADVPAFDEPPFAAVAPVAGPRTLEEMWA